MAIPHIPCLRFGDPYVSLNKIEVNDYRDGTPKATVSQVNAGVVRRDLQRIDEARAALRKFTTAELIEIGAKAGEIFLNSIDHDGNGLGYNKELIEQIEDIKIPLIICGGVGDYSDFEFGLKNKNVDAVAAANIFHHRDQSVYFAKKHLFEEGYSVRMHDIFEK